MLVSYIYAFEFQSVSVSVIGRLVLRAPRCFDNLGKLIYLENTTFLFEHCILLLFEIISSSKHSAISNN